MRKPWGLAHIAEIALANKAAGGISAKNNVVVINGVEIAQVPRRHGNIGRYEAEDWCDDDVRCKKAAIPEDNRQFQSKTQLALAMLEVAKQRGIQFGYRRNVSSLSTVFGRRKVNVAWLITKFAAGMLGIAIWP